MIKLLLNKIRGIVTEEIKDRVKRRLMPYFDLTAWIMLVISLTPLLILDHTMALTLLHWTAYGLALAGIAVIISRALLSQIQLSVWVDRAAQGNVAAGIIVAGVSQFLGILMLALVLWAKT